MRSLPCYSALHPYGESSLVMEACCVKLMAKREIKNHKAVTLKNGKPATQGECPKCGTEVFRIGKS